MKSARDTWAGFNTESRSINELLPYARNARTHSDEQIAQIAASIREFGFTNPVLIDPDNTILAGHGRVMAARQLGEEVVPVIVARGWSEAQKRAYVIADNKLALNAGWNEELLKLELTDLAEMDFDTGLTGFSDKELADLMRAAPETAGDPEEIPEFPVKPTAKTGDVWILGKHRLVCGDSTNADHVALCLNGVTPHLMVTDPPYGVEYDASWRDKSLGAARTGSRATGKVTNDNLPDWRAAWALFPGDVAYVWHGATRTVAVAVAESLVAANFDLRTQIIWRKSQFVISRGDYHSQHEPCFYAVRKGRVGHWSGDRKQSTVWDIDKPQKSETGHSTQKPVECMARPIRNNSSPGQAIYEPFCGSGTTLIAAELEGRVCHAIEIEPKYCDVIIQRFQKTFAARAIREADGAAYDDIAFEKSPGATKDETRSGARKESAKSGRKAQKSHKGAGKTHKSAPAPHKNVPAPHKPDEDDDSAPGKVH